MSVRNKDHVLPSATELPIQVAEKDDGNGTAEQGDSQHVSQPNKPPPNGGWAAWLQVSGSFVLYFNTLGLLNTFGAFQSYFERELLRDNSPSAISWIGSLQTFFLMAVGVVIGPLYDLGYLRSLLITGTFFVTFGFMMTSISTEYWQVLLAQGVSIGFGTSCLIIPSIALVPPYFTTKRARAMGIATVGSSLGGTIYPLIFQSLHPQIGFGWTVRVIGFIAFAMCCFPIVVMRPLVPPKPAARRSGRGSFRSFVKSAALTERRYIIYCVAIVFSNIAFFEPLFYLQSYAIEHGMRGQDMANYLLVILNAASIPGRIVPSYVADIIGPLDTFIAICALTAATNFYWISVTNAAGNIAFAALYGFFSGGVVSLAPVVLTTITADLGRLGTRLGVVSVLKGLGSLVGPPAAGALLGATGSYLGVQLFAAVFILLTAAFSFLLRVVVGRDKARKKAEEAEDAEEVESGSGSSNAPDGVRG